MNAMFTDVASQATTDYSKVMDVVRAMKPELVRPEQIEDVVALLEWLQQNAVRQDDQIKVARADLEAREAALKAAQLHAKRQLRTANAVISTTAPKRSWWWRA